jgi:3-hydroxybutyryl-CoA dehydratase
MDERIKPGSEFTKTREVTEELIAKFAEISGDYNPIHLDESFAKETRFGRRIAHGMLSGAFISGVLGMSLPGLRIVYLGQTLRFIAPVFIGDRITTKAIVTKIREDKPIVTLETTCTNQAGEQVVSGEATIMIME